jgi:hypothetical protein
MSDDRTKAAKAWEARQEAARYRIFNAATNAAEATDEGDDERYCAVLDRAGNAAEAAAAEIAGYRTTPIFRGVGHTPQTVLAARLPAFDDRLQALEGTNSDLFHGVLVRKTLVWKMLIGIGSTQDD